ncbi:S8 family serine peptidase [Candidatus Woesearchaeota archaeon]|nr:S8 family serine peptidase [Candidatus Woesearchaeota archaeon]
MNRAWFFRILAVAIVAFVAVGTLGSFILALAAPEDKVTVIVYVREGAQQRHFSRGIVPLVASVTSESVIAAIPDGERENERSFSSFNGFTARVSRAQYERLKSNPDLEVFEDKIYHIMLDGSGPLINATRVPGLIYNGSNITGNTVGVCVLDTGINYGHAALGGCTTSQMTGGTCGKVPGGYDAVNDDNDPDDDHGHGSHVAGIIASTDSTYRGIAPNASIIPVKVCNDGGSCSTANITTGIDWCVYNASKFNISVISISLGGAELYGSWCDGSSSFRRPVDDAVVKNISVVVAAGNSNPGSTTGISDPACVKNATAVGSTTKSDLISSFSNRNSITDLLAPGTDITSVDWDGTFVQISGTSMATPHVSGAIALLAQYQKLTASTNLSPYAAFLALNTTGVNLTDSGIQFARISVYNAILSLDADPPNLTYVPPTLANNSNVNLSAGVYVNITSSEVLKNASLEWNNVTNTINYSMNGSGLNWFRNHSSSSSGEITYRVWGNDSAGHWGVTETRTVQVNNTPPRIDSFLPASISHNIAEPANQTFNITFTDTENDVVLVDWYVNGTLQSSARNTNFTFLGNFSQASQLSNGTYNITAVVSDGSLSNQLNWTLAINNTNRALQWASIANQTSGEDTPFSFLVVATDLDNDTITYYVNNTANFSINSSRGNITLNLSTVGNFSGAFHLALNASDGLVNVSETIIVNITPINDTPTLFTIANLTINETDFANVTAVADDAENDVLNFTINDTARFNVTGSNRTAANFSWKTNLSDSGVFQFRVNVTDFNSSNLGFFNVSVVDRPDLDGDGTPDIYDGDDDNDGVADSDDSVLGNLTTLNSSTLPSSALNITINGSANASRLLNEALFVNISNGTRPLMEFYWNFSLGNLTLNFTVDVQDSSSSVGSILIKGLVLQENQTKNITLNRLSSTNQVCVKDADVSSISDVSSACTGANETLVSCPGVAGRYNCSIVDGNNFYRITNVSFTAAREQAAPVSQQTVSGGGSSGGGGGGAGGGAAPGGASPKVVQVFTLVKEGETAIMRINKSSLAFTRVAFTAAAKLSSVNVEVSLLNESRISQRPSSQLVLYQYLNLSTRLSPGDVSYAAVEFRVARDWLLDNGFAETDISLLRYSVGSWEQFRAVQIGSDSNYHYYLSQLPGFSVFAIAAEAPLQPVRQQPALNESDVTATNVTAAESNVSSLPQVKTEGQNFFSERNLKFAIFLAAATMFGIALLLLKKRKDSQLSSFLSRVAFRRGRR